MIEKGACLQGDFVRGKLYFPGWDHIIHLQHFIHVWDLGEDGSTGNQCAVAKEGCLTRSFYIQTAGSVPGLSAWL